MNGLRAIYPYPSRVVQTTSGGYTYTPRGSIKRPPGGIPIPFCAGFLHFGAKIIEEFAHREAFRAQRLQNCTKGVQMELGVSPGDLAHIALATHLASASSQG